MSATPETLPAERAGLSEAEAARRLAERGRWRQPPSSRSYASIVRANVFTVFNLILGVAGLATLLFGDARDALFLGVLVANTAIGIVQEVRAKRTLDRLAALVAPRATVVRDGEPRTIDVGEVVVGDLVRAGAGDQVIADGRIVSEDGLQLDESVLTGESEPVSRAVDEEIRSGSFVAEGVAEYVATAVGEDSYAARLTGQARAFRHERSPLDLALNRLLLWIVAVGAPLAILLLITQLVRHVGVDHGVPTVVAAVVALVPEGLILLASLTHAVAAVRIARRGALAQQLNAIESLAAVDTICIDKTGTLTENALRLVETVPAAGVERATLERLLARFAASAPTRNGTLTAVAEGLPGAAVAVEAQVPFSSRWRWSALTLDGESYALGAPEPFELGPLDERRAQEADGGRRVLAFGRVPGALDGVDPREGLPPGTEPLGLVVLAEQLRPNIRETIAYLHQQGVELRVLSGDAPATVAAIAADTGIATAAPLDGRELPEDPDELGALLEEHAIVGRISPEGKQRVVEALRARGRYVAMVGDGVNDVAALKAARLGIAQGSGAQMAKSVADLVLVNGDFGTVPPMVAEGRQILRNLQRVARLFVTKSVFAAIFALTVAITAIAYPFLPRHLSLASSLTIGIPAFFLALAPSSGAWQPSAFLRDIARFAIPAGIGTGAGVLACYALALEVFDRSTLDARTVSTMALIGLGLFVILRLEAENRDRPIWVPALCAAMVLGFVLMDLIPAGRDFFDLVIPDAGMLALAGGGIVLGIALILAGLRIAARDGPRVPAEQVRRAAG